MTSNEEEIRLLVHDWAEAARAKDVERVLLFHAPGVRLFDVVGPLQFSGIDGLRKRIEEWFSSFDGPIGYELSDVIVAADSEVAFVCSLNHVHGKRREGAVLDMWWRGTLCFQKLQGRWMVSSVLICFFLQSVAALSVLLTHSESF